MERADKGLAFMLQYENVAWYDAGEVRILDRRERMKTAHRHRSDLAEAFAADRVAGPGSFEVQRLGRVGDMVRLGAPA